MTLVILGALFRGRCTILLRSRSLLGSGNGWAPFRLLGRAVRGNAGQCPLEIGSRSCGHLARTGREFFHVLLSRTHL